VALEGAALVRTFNIGRARRSWGFNAQTGVERWGSGGESDAGGPKKAGRGSLEHFELFL
jgi:hypothetical protein